MRSSQFDLLDLRGFNCTSPVLNRKLKCVPITLPNAKFCYFASKFEVGISGPIDNKEILPDKEFNPEPHHYHNFQIVQHFPRLLLVLLDGGKDGEGQAHEDKAEDHRMIAHGHLAAGSLKEIVDDCLSLLDPGITP